MESIEQAQQSHSTTSERPGLCNRQTSSCWWVAGEDKDKLVAITQITSERPGLSSSESCWWVAGKTMDASRETGE